MKRNSGVLFLVILFFAVAACSGEPSSSEKSPAPAAQKVAGQFQDAQGSSSAKVFQTITSLQAQTLMAKRKDLLLVDLREAKELREGYIAGSQLIPMSALAKGTQSLPADRPLLLICAVGGRSLAVGQYFSSKGYPEIYNLQGGISAWKKAGLPLQF